MEEELRNKLIERQGKQTDEEFALQLGVSRATWQQFRDGKTKLGLSLIKGIHKAYPSLIDLCNRVLIAG